MADEPEDERIPVNLEDDDTPIDPVDEQGTEEAESEDPDADSLTDADPSVEAQPKGDRSIGKLREERRQLAEENARITRELNELRNRPAPQYQAPAETPQQRADRLALLSPEDRIRTEVEERLSGFQYQQHQLNTQILDNTDKAAFAAKVAANPLARKLEAEVERRLATLRQQGSNAPREAVFTFLVGERALAQMGKGQSKAAANRQRQQAKPANARGDVRPDRTRREGTTSDIEHRFGDVPI